MSTAATPRPGRDRRWSGAGRYDPASAMRKCWSARGSTLDVRLPAIPGIEIAGTIVELGRKRCRARGRRKVSPAPATCRYAPAAMPNISPCRPAPPIPCRRVCDLEARRPLELPVAYPLSHGSARGRGKTGWSIPPAGGGGSAAVQLALQSAGMAVIGTPVRASGARCWPLGARACDRLPHEGRRRSGARRRPKSAAPI